MKVICYNNKTTGGKILDSLTLGKIYDSIQDLPYEEISKKTKIPIGTVKTQIFRAKELLYQMLAPTAHKY